MLPDILDRFSEKYGSIRIEPEPIDVTDCFATGSGYDAPQSFGKLPIKRVLLYTVFGAPLLSKYKMTESEHVIWNKGKPVIRDFDDEMKALTCLCLHDIRNVSLHEVGDAVRYGDKLQGFRKRHVECIEDAIDSKYPDFLYEVDTAIIFAGKPRAIRKRIALNAMWLEQMVTLGSGMLDEISDPEAKLMRRIFQKKVLTGDVDAILHASYMYGRALYVPETTEFLERKVKAYRDYCE